MKLLNFFNLIILIFITTFFIFTSSFGDINYFLELTYRIEDQELNFKDYICFLNNFTIYPLIFLGDILGYYTLAYYLLACSVGILISFLMIRLYENIFEIKRSINRYYFLFYFILPFGIAGYYVDIILYLFASISVFFYFKQGSLNFYLSAIFLAFCVFIKYFSATPFVLAFGFIFFIEWYYANFKLKYLIKPLKFFIFFSFVTTFMLSIYIYLNDINIELMYEYLFKEMLDSGSNRLTNLFNSIFFLNYNIFKAIINFNVGIILFYLFIICFYFSIYLLIKIILTKKDEKQALLLIFIIVSSSFTFLLAGRDWNHKILFLPILLIMTIDYLNFKYLNNYKITNVLKAKYLLIPFILIYSLVPLNERLKLKQNKFNSFTSENFNNYFTKIDKGRFKNLFYSLRSNYLIDNGFLNYNDQLSEISNFLNEDKNKKYNLMFIDEQSKIISYLTDKKNLTPCCGISDESFPPKYPLNNKIFIKNFLGNLQERDTLLIVCHFDRFRNELCLNKTTTVDKKLNISIPSNLNRFIELENYIKKNMGVYYSTKNFTIFSNNKVYK